jgi:hypothetical protein
VFEGTSGWISRSSWDFDVSWDNICWPWFLDKGSWSSIEWISSWSGCVGVWDAVVSGFWESNSSNDTVLKGLSFWSVWAVFEGTSGWISRSSWNWDVSWDYVCWPWSLSEGSWSCVKWISSWSGCVGVWDAVVSGFWESNSSNDTVLKGLSFWSVWAVFEGTSGWISRSSWNWDVSWDYICWPWSLNKRPCWVAVESGFWIWDSSSGSIS